MTNLRNGMLLVAIAATLLFSQSAEAQRPRRSRGEAKQGQADGQSQPQPQGGQAQLPLRQPRRRRPRELVLLPRFPCREGHSVVSRIIQVIPSIS